MARAMLGKSPVKEVIREMTREEKVSLVRGTGMNVAHLPAELQAPAVGQSSWRVPGELAASPRIRRYASRAFSGRHPSSG